MSRVSLSYEGNPYSPAYEFDKWWNWDPKMSEKCCSILARIAEVSEETPVEEQNQALEDAIDEICRINVFGNLVKHVDD